jgi:hypothetical protein
MKPLGYREIFWDISLSPSGEGFTIAAYDDEREMFARSQESRASRAIPIDISTIVGRSGTPSNTGRSDTPSNTKWTRRRVSSDEAHWVGAQLWTGLPPPIQDVVQAVGGQVRLKVFTDVPGVGDLPWEWLNDGTGQAFALRPDSLVVRSVPLRFPVHPLSVHMPLGVLLLVPNPKDERLLNADLEIHTINQALAGPGFKVTILDMPLLAGFTSALASTQPNIVHYVGHGGLVRGEGNLILPDPDGGSRWVSATELASLLPSSVRLLCLSTPSTTDNYQVLGLSHLARATSLTGLPTTVTNQYPLDVAAVTRFWSAFYASLLSGGNVNVAVHNARIQVAQADPTWADWASFSLVVRDQTGVSFEIRPPEEAGVRRPAEYRAQFSAELANDLAQQVQLLGDETPAGLRQQYEFEEKRASQLLDGLNEA